MSEVSYVVQKVLTSTAIPAPYFGQEEKMGWGEGGGMVVILRLAEYLVMVGCRGARRLAHHTWCQNTNPADSLA